MQRRSQLTRQRKEQAGFALVGVLVLLIVSGLVLLPLLLLMTAGLTSSQVREASTQRFYAADAGIEDAAYKVRNDNPNLPESGDPPYSYTITDLNGCEVDVIIENIWALTGLETPDNGTTPHSELVTVGEVIGTDTYQIDISYDGTKGPLQVNRIGAWLPPGFSYVPGSSDGITEHEDVPDEPEEVAHGTGTALIWDFDEDIALEGLPSLTPTGGGLRPGVEYPLKRSMLFQFTGPGAPNGAFSWIRTNRQDVYLSWDTSAGAYKVTSVAQDDEARETTIGTYIARAKLHERVQQVYGDYRAIGNSLMYDSDGDSYRETWLPESGATITKRTPQVEDLDIPQDAKVEAAYLYWAAWWKQEDADKEVTLQVDSGLPMQINADKWSVLLHPFLPNESVPEGKAWYAYACFADVTEEIGQISTPGNATYTITVGAASGDVSAPYPGWYDTSWSQRAPVVVNNPGSGLTDYQIKVDVTYDADMQPDFDDIRFVDPDSSTALSHWRENYTASASATFWVKIPSIPSGAKTIYMYYGNAAASSASDGNATFVFFDDFEAGTLNKWTTVLNGTFWMAATDQALSGTYSLRGSGTSSSDKYIVATGLDVTDLVLESMWRVSYTGPDISQALRASSTTPINDYEINWEGQWTMAKKIGGSFNSIRSESGTIPSNTWFKMTTIISGTSMKVLKDDVELVPPTGWTDVGTQLATGTVGFRAWTVTSGQYWWIDDVRVRKYASQEPTTSVGSEEGAERPVSWSYAGWSLIVIYSSEEEDAHQLYLYDQFGHAHDSYLYYPIEGFLAPSGAEGSLSYFVGEGDEHLGSGCSHDGCGDYIQFKGESDTEWHYLYDESNPQFNVMNGLSSGLAGEFIDGVDIETFPVSSYLSEGDTSAELKITTHSDGWDLVYIIISFRSDVAIESGLFPVRLVTYTFGSE